LKHKKISSIKPLTNEPSLKESVLKEFDERSETSTIDEEITEIESLRNTLNNVAISNENSTAEEWTQISNSSSYLPSDLDVGRRLKIEVSALLLSNNSLLAGPITIVTEPVLSAPNPPPKRSLLTIAGAISGLAVAVRFRVISYNVLAEQYATKQVFFYLSYY
jgi:hypothetical protein